MSILLAVLIGVVVLGLAVVVLVLWAGRDEI